MIFNNFVHNYLKYIDINGTISSQQKILILVLSINPEFRWIYSQNKKTYIKT